MSEQNIDLLGPITHADIAVALCSLDITSAMVPPPRVKGAAPTQPARNRNTISILRLLLTAQHIVNMKNKTLHAWYSGSRPYISDIGAITE
jgi:hypothetical protein